MSLFRGMTPLFLSEKQAIFSDMTAKTDSAQPIDRKIQRRIYGSGRGSVVSATQFADLASRAAVDKALSRLAQRGVLHRLDRGLYLYPKQHPMLGDLLPSVDAVAKAIAGRDRTRLQPAGAYAANRLGLSEQVPGKVVFLTDGASRTVQVGPMTLELRRTTPKNMAAAGRLSGLIIQAFRYLGKEHVTPERVTHLKRTLPVDERRAVIKDLRLAPAWMQPILRDIAEA